MCQSSTGIADPQGMKHRRNAKGWSVNLQRASVPEGQQDNSPGAGVPGTRYLRAGVEDNPERSRRGSPG